MSHPLRWATSSTARCLALVVVVAGMAAYASPAQGAPAARLQIGRVAASSFAVDGGTKVRATVVVKNRTGARQGASVTRLYLVSAQHTFSLGRARLPAVRAGGKQVLRLARLAPGGALAGDYRLRACLEPRPVGRCRTTGGAPVQIGHAELSVPADLDLGAAQVGTPVTTQLTVSNVGHSRSGRLSAAIEGVDTGEFSLGSGSCPASLDAGASCELDVTFTPQRFGTAGAAVSVSARLAGPVIVDLTGTGLAPPCGRQGTAMDRTASRRC